MKPVRLFSLSLFILCRSMPAADLYMTPSGAGSFDGSNWTNALPKTQLPAALNTTMQPGDSLHLGSGNYGNSTLTVTSSGTPDRRKRVVGEDTGNGLPVFDGGNWNRMNPAR